VVEIERGEDCLTVTDGLDWIVLEGDATRTRSEEVVTPWLHAKLQTEAFDLFFGETEFVVQSMMMCNAID
jgi:hypothetical protein